VIIICLDAPKSICETEKTLKTLSTGQKNPKKNQKTQKNQKKTKKTHWAGFFFLKPGFFPTLQISDPTWAKSSGSYRIRINISLVV
jgi:hypothetical protein